MTTIAERILTECGIGHEAAQELIALVRDNRTHAAWELFQVLQPDKLKRTAMIRKATTKYAAYKKEQVDDTAVLIEKCLVYMTD